MDSSYRLFGNGPLMNMMNKPFHGNCHLCYGFGHKVNQCRSRTTSMNSGQRENQMLELQQVWTFC